MFFVVAIGNLIIYFVLGWTTNVISQVSFTKYIALRVCLQSL